MLCFASWDLLSSYDYLSLSRNDPIRSYTYLEFFQRKKKKKNSLSLSLFTPQKKIYSLTEKRSKNDSTNSINSRNNPDSPDKLLSSEAGKNRIPEKAIEQEAERGGKKWSRNGRDSVVEASIGSVSALKRNSGCSSGRENLFDDFETFVRRWEGRGRGKGGGGGGGRFVARQYGFFRV